MYVSTKRYGHEAGFSIAYRQYKADSHCKYIHGYSLAFEFEFESEELDVRNWVCDFGGFTTLKSFLEDYFDHTLLVAEDDPLSEEQARLGEIGLAQVRIVHKTGCEGLAEYLFWHINAVWMIDNGYAPRVFCRKVRVFETPNNSAFVEFTRDDWEKRLVDIYSEEL
jgi:6-pyruvoyltetrahydropterin/6-carboxytetrahydropterin synthase